MSKDKRVWAPACLLNCEGMRRNPHYTEGISIGNYDKAGFKLSLGGGKYRVGQRVIFARAVDEPKMAIRLASVPLFYDYRNVATVIS